MAKKDIIDKYQAEIVNIDKQIITLGDFKTAIQSNINQLISPTAQLDEQIAQLTVDINKKIYELSGISSSAIVCGCGTYVMDEYSNQISIGSTYYYEQAKAHRMNIEDTTYTDTNPFGKLIFQTEPKIPTEFLKYPGPYPGPEPFGELKKVNGSTSFTSGIGSTTIVVGADQNSILELIVSNPGSGFISSTYYGRTLVGGAGTGAKADIVVSAGGSVSSVIINNGGTGYAINNILTISSFAGATFTVTNVGSPILGIGVDTYIVASSGIGSVFIPDIDIAGISTCPATDCVSYAASFSLVQNQIIALRLQRNKLLNGTNTFKAENKKKYTERYGYNFAEANIKERKNVVNNVINTLNDSTYNQYFL